MKTVLAAVLSCFCTLALPGCYVTTYPTPVGYPEAEVYPGYVYTYSNGCWADDVWYAPCPWAPGPAYGYYGWYGGGWRYHTGIVWGYRRGYPPPRYVHPPYYAPRPYYGPRRYAPAHPHPGGYPRGRRF